MSNLNPSIRSAVMRTIYIAAAGVLALLPKLSHACAVCSTGREDENADAFLAMTLFMTVTPLLILCGSIWWFVRRMLEREAEIEEAREVGRSVQDEAAPALR